MAVATACLVTACAAHPGPAPAQTVPGPPSVSPSPSITLAPPAVPSPVRGVTIDSVTDLDAVEDAVRASSSPLTLRIVFDPREPVTHYRDAVRRLHRRARLMGQIADSSDLARIGVAALRRRTEALLATYGDEIALWEIGNELNGAWVGRDQREIDGKTLAIYEAVRRHGGRTAVTLNHWSGPQCYDHAWEATLTYAAAMPAALRDGVDYVLLSIYETACAPRQLPSAAEIGDTLAGLGQVFPHAWLGIGEIGAQNRSDHLPADPDLAEKTRIAERYYGMDAELRRRLGVRFVGGYFWWYYVEDAVPRARPESLWPTLDRLLRTL